MFSIDSNLCIQCGSCVKACPMAVFTQAEDGTVTAQQKECLDCFHCAAACPVQAISHHELGHDRCYAPSAPSGSLLEKLACKMVPDTEEPEKIVELDERLLTTPPVALERCRSLTAEMAEAAASTLRDGAASLLDYTAEHWADYDFSEVVPPPLSHDI